MTIQKRFISVASIAVISGAVISGLAACAKPGEGRGTIVPTTSPPSTSANPLKAIEENAAAGKNLTPEQKEALLQQRADSVEAASRLFANEVVPLGSADKTVTVPPGSPAASGVTGGPQAASGVPTPVEPAASATAPDASPAVTDAQPPSSAVSTLPLAASAPAVVEPAASATAASAPAAPAPAAPAPATAASANQPSSIPMIVDADDAKKRAFVLAMIEPVMHLNAAVYRERFEIERIRDKIAKDKKELTTPETEWLLRVKSRYQLGASDSFENLLERVDGVKLPFLVAPLALVSGWNSPRNDLKKFFADRIETLNTSAGDENFRFRKARGSLDKRTSSSESVALMQAFLGIKEEAQLANEPSIAAINDINRVSQDPAVAAKIKEVYQALLNEK